MGNSSVMQRGFTVLLTLIVGVALSFGASLVLPCEEAHAATKTPAKVKTVKISKKATTSVKVSWSKASKAKKYQVAYKKASASKWDYKTVSGKSTTLKSLSNNTKYQVKVRAVNGSKKGKWSSTKTVSTKAKTPAKVSGLKSSSVSSNSFKASWSGTKYAKKYQVAYKKSSASKWTYKTTTSKSITLKSLSANTKYNVKVRAVNTGSTTKYGSWSSTKSVTTEKTSLSTIRSQMLSGINKERLNNKAFVVKLDNRLNATAQAKAKDMYNTGKLSHDSKKLGNCATQCDNAGIAYVKVAENIASGYGSVSAVINGWMNSSGHKANILNTTLTHIGVGYYKGYWVLQLALVYDDSVYCDRCGVNFTPNPNYIYFTTDDDGYSYVCYQHTKCAKMIEKCPLCAKGYFKDVGINTNTGSRASACDSCGHAAKHNVITKCPGCNKSVLNNTRTDKYTLTFNSYCKNTEADALVSHYFDSDSYYYQAMTYEKEYCKSCGKYLFSNGLYQDNYDESLEKLIADLKKHGKDASKAEQEYVTWELKS